MKKELLYRGIANSKAIHPYIQPSSPLTSYFSKKAFNLAEVIIVLVIVAVIALMTVPSLVQGMQERATVAALTKTQSTLSNAFTLAVQENGTPDTWGFTAGGSPAILNKLKPYLNIAQDCTDFSKGCWPTGVDYPYLTSSNGSRGIQDNEPWPKLKLTDGTLIIGYIDNTSCNWQIGNSIALQNACGEYWVDTNGYKGPNQVGKDMFLFWLTIYGIMPAGSE